MRDCKQGDTVTGAHKLQLLDISPEIEAELIGLDKIEIENPDKLPIGDEYIELESALLFDGCPLRFLKHRNTLYFWDYAEEVGGSVEYAYLTPLKGGGVHTTEYLATEIGKRRARKRKLLQTCDRICRSAAKTVDISHVKYFVRRGQLGYNLACAEVAGVFGEKIEKAADKIINAPEQEIIKAQIEPRPEKPEKAEVERLKPSPQVERIYKSEIEVAEQSDLEKGQEQIPEDTQIEQLQIEHEPEKTVLQTESESIKLKHTKHEKGVKKQNAKSNSKGTERVKG